MIDFDAIIETYQQDRRRFYSKAEIIELLKKLKTLSIKEATHAST